MRYDLSKITENEQQELLELLEQDSRERVSPKMERFREPWRIKIAHGGRAAGGKSWGCASLIIQRCHRKALRVCCFREVQKSLEESSYRLMVDTIDRLRYTGWKVTKESLESPVGSHIIFRGLADMRSANQMKSLEGYDIFWLEEASAISKESLSVLLPTLRKEGSELWATLNRDMEQDPIMSELWDTDRNDILRVELQQGKIDNPWFPAVLQQELETAYKNNPDEALHVFGGQPRSQGDNAVMSRVAIRAAMNRTVKETDPDEIGADISRFGNDRTEIYRRRGAKIVGHKEMIHKDTVYVANAIWNMAGQDRKVVIKCDVGGLGAGVVDKLRELGANVIEINFGGAPRDRNRFTSVADEMYFTFAEKIDEISIPNDPDLMQELSGRLYDYDKLGRRKIEPKDKYKARVGKSPDKADALVMCYYTDYRHGGGVGFAPILGF